MRSFGREMWQGEHLIPAVNYHFTGRAEHMKQQQEMFQSGKESPAAESDISDLSLGEQRYRVASPPPAFANSLSLA